MKYHRVLGATFTMVDNLVLKASYGQGFRAPNMSDLYGATAFSAESATDYYGCQLDGVSEADCPDRQFDTYIGSNPDLGAETSETMSIGATYTYNDNWVGKVNYVVLDLQNAVEQVSAQDMLNVDFNTGGLNPLVHGTQQVLLLRFLQATKMRSMMCSASLLTLH